MYSSPANSTTCAQMGRDDLGLRGWDVQVHQACITLQADSAVSGAAGGRHKGHLLHPAPQQHTVPSLLALSPFCQLSHAAKHYTPRVRARRGRVAQNIKTEAADADVDTSRRRHQCSCMRRTQLALCADATNRRGVRE